MNPAVFLPTTFKPDAASSLVVSARAGKFCADHFKIPFLDETMKDVEVKNYDPLIIINFPFLYSKRHDLISTLVRKAKKIVWLSNDYTCKPPTTNNPKPQSSIRRAFGDRKDSILWWTNRPKSAKDHGGHYVNWNALSHAPIKDLVTPHALRKSTCVYYGAHRDDRIASFQRYFQDPHGLEVTCSNSAVKKFRRYGDRLVINPPLDPLIPALSDYAASLYLEDDDTHQHYHSLATRFYEAVSAETALFVDFRCVETFAHAGESLSHDWLVDSPTSIRLKLPMAAKIAKAQKAQWNRDHQAEMRKQLNAAMKDLAS